MCGEPLEVQLKNLMHDVFVNGLYLGFLLGIMCALIGIFAAGKF